jgi:two-component system phosphate regulon response regulator OmpR
MKRTAILAIDDDPEIRKVIGKYLEEDGYSVHTAANAAESNAILSQQPIDLILLDMVLPDSDGLDLMTEFRSKSKVPIIVVSGKSDATDRIVGLEMGADDYLTKPFHMRELSARIKSVLRRAEAQSPQHHDIAPTAEQEIYKFGQWTMNCAKYEVCNGKGDPVSLTSGEFDLLRALVNSPNRVLKREHLFEVTRGIDYDTYDRAVDIQIGRLRKKLGDDPHNPSLIKTVRGVGYIFIGDVARA